MLYTEKEILILTHKLNNTDSKKNATIIIMLISFQELRYQMDAILKQKIANPSMELYDPSNGSLSPTSQLIDAIIDLITTEDYSQQVNKMHGVRSPAVCCDA